MATAQWSPFTNTTPQNNGGEFWDNKSQDGTKCNIGYVLTNQATAAGCANERPNNWLPLENVTVTEQYGTGTFALFNSDPFDVGFTLYGDIAGQNRNWGIFTLVGNTRTRYDLNANVCTVQVVGGCTVTGGQLFPNIEKAPWGIWISTTDNVFRYSDTDAQFAWFRGPGNQNYFGIEDINVAKGSDRDFNDVVFSARNPGGDLSTVPEPSTYVLMASGLMALGVVARRRKTVTA